MQRCIASRATARVTPSQSVRSDYDVTIVVAEQAQPWRHDTRTDPLDEVICTVEALADTSVHWQRHPGHGRGISAEPSLPLAGCSRSPQVDTINR
jgi:hypothetical protein